MKQSALVLSLLTLAIIAVACGQGGPAGGTRTAPASMVVTPPVQSVFLRASFDDDPSPFLGRFVPNGLQPGQVDENQAVKTRCSEFITYKEVKASGKFDEVFNASTNVGASFGVPAIAGGDASAGQSQAMRVSYKLSKKLRAEVSDTAALDQCCNAAPDQCADVYLGEFYYGSGHVYHAAGSQAEFEANGVTSSAVGDINFKDQVAWKRVTEFEEVYFAFRTQNNTLGGGSQDSDSTACEWVDSVPSDLDGTYFVGISPPAADEAGARDAAMINARVQVVKFLGEYIKTEASTTASVLEGVLDDAKTTNTVAEGLTSKVKDKKWCKAERIDTPKGSKYVARVLAYFPNADKKEAAQAAVKSIAATLNKDGKLKGKDKAQFKKLMQKFEK